MLPQIYASKELIDTLVIGHFDAHGTLTSAALISRLRKEDERIVPFVEFPTTGPQGFKDVLRVFDKYAPRRVFVIDIPVNVQKPQETIDVLRQMAEVAPVYFYDHHETDLAFLHQLHSIGIYASIFSTAVDMAVALHLLNEEPERTLAIIGIVADRDKSILRIVSKDEVERRLLKLANVVDVVVRNPRQFGWQSLSHFAEALAEKGASLIENLNVNYPPEMLAKELEAKIVREGTTALLIDWTNMPQEFSQWVPKTLEQLLLLRRRDVVIAVVPGINPKTRQVEGFDVRVLKYWLSSYDVEIEKVVVETLKPQPGSIVGHADYVSIRYKTVDEAINAANKLFDAIEGKISYVAHLIEESRVAQAVKHDYQQIIRLLERIAKALEEGATAKKEQVELLRELYKQDQRTRAD